jgi:hypothetical protein
MSWPQSQEYNEAIQTPKVCFTDPDLKQGSVKLNAMGLPVPISGAFANVYQITTATGKWAIRCFVREVKDSHHRYDEISKALGANRPAYTAPFEYQRNGIRVGSTAYPIVKMQWLTGELLSDYVARNLSNPAQLAQFADRWVALVADLRARKLAHGDLQHGNVLVVNDEPKLIDYDGMFVPAFQGLRSNEVGHPNFQHPQRKETDFGTFTDNFSAWVIYASVRVIATSPEIYNLSRGLGRDEGLLFSREDYANPNVSPIFSELRQHPDESVGRLAKQIATFLTQTPKDVPPLDTTNFPPLVIGRATSSAASSNGGSREWWRDHIKAEPATEPAAPSVPPITVDFGTQSAAKREMLGLLILSYMSFLAGQTGAIGNVGYFLVQAAIIFFADRRLRFHFNESPVGAARDRHAQEVHLKTEELDSKKSRLEQLQNKTTQNEKQEKDLAAQANTRVAELTGVQGAEIKQVYTDKAVALSELNQRRQVLVVAEERELRTAIGQNEAQIRTLQDRLRSLPQEKADLVQQYIDKEHAATMRNYLSNHPVSGATIPGIGEKFKMTLRYRGINTAADVTFGGVRVIPNFGQARTNAIVAWREALEAHYQTRLLNRLSPSFMQQIEQQFRTKQRDLEQEIQSLQSGVMAVRSRIVQAYAVQRAQFPAEERAIESAAQTRVDSINARFGAQKAGIRNDLEQQLRNLRNDTANVRIAVNSLETDVRRLQTWLRDVGVPRTKSYEETLKFSKYLKAVFTSKFNS